MFTVHRSPFSDGQRTTRTDRAIILGVLLLISFFVIPVNGMPFRLSREILALWMGVGLVIVFTPSWWLRGLVGLALVHLIINPAGIAYWDMMLLCTFCGIYTIVRKMNEQWTEWLLMAVCLIAVVQAVLIFTQLAGIWQVGSYPRGMLANANDAGAFLALSLPAFLSGRRLIRLAAAALVLGALIVTRCTTAFFAAWFGSILWIILENKIDLRLKAVVTALIFLITSVFFLKVDPIQKTIQGDSRRVAWQRTLMAIKDKPWGYGLGSYKELFPAMNVGTSLSRFKQAHNEYLQMTFELGWPFLVLVAGFLASLICRLLGINRQSSIVNRQSSIGLVILAVGCAGFFWLHLADVAFLGITWLAIWDKSKRRNGKWAELNSLS